MPTTTAIDLASNVAAIGAAMRAAAADVDDARTLAPAITRALKDAGVFRYLAPTTVGGAEGDPLTFFDAIESLSYADGSVGWCALLGGCYATFGGMLPPTGAVDLFGDPETIAAGAFAPIGVAHEVEGGYRVTGRWSLGSGSCHANWFIGGAVVMRDGQPVMLPHGAPLMREMFFPASVTTIIDTWDATGLRGTASHDYSVEDVFVPAEHSVWFQDAPTLDGPLYTMPPIAMFATFIGAVPLGIARHALDELIELSLTKVPVLSAAVLAEKAVAHSETGQVAVALEAARVHLRDTLQRVWEKVVAGQAPTLSDRGRLWAASTHAGHVALNAVDRLYTAAGSSSVYRRCPIDRCLRDVRTAVQHVCLQKGNFELMGRQLMGRDTLMGPWGMDYRGEG